MRGGIDTLLRAIIIVIFSVLVICVCWQVISRYALGTPSVLTDEIARFLFMWLALIGGAYTFGARRHLAIDLFTMTLRGRVRLLVEGLILVIVLSFAVIVMLWGGGQLVARTFVSGQVTPALRLPMGWIYIAIPAAGAIISYYALLFLGEVARGQLHEEDDSFTLPQE